jgi:uncharacterized protein
MQGSDATRAGPVTPTERIAVLDVLRGFALYGVFVVNFVYSSGAGFGAGPEDGLADRIGWIVVTGLLETKFVSLFSLLFGMGLVLQMERGAARGVDMDRVYLRRLSILFVLGFLHGCLLFAGDILLLYAVVGFVLLLCHRWRAGRLALAALLPLAIGLALSLVSDVLLGDGPEEVGFLWGALDELHAVSVTEGPLSLTIFMRMLEFAYISVVLSFTSFNWRVVALFFLGAALMKRGLLGAGHRTLHGRVAVLGLALGLALEAFYVLVDETGVDAPWAAHVLSHELGSLTLAFGLAGAVAWAVHGGLCTRLSAWLGCVGRTALTNYLAQSALMNVVLYWFGLGLWEEIDAARSIVLVTGLFALQVLVSVLWMRSFRIGPVEWLWRALTYGRRPRWR